MMLAWVVRAILCDKATFDVFGGCESAFIPQIGAIPEGEKNDAIFFKLLKAER